MKLNSKTKKALAVVLVLLALTASFGGGYLTAKLHYRNVMAETYAAMREGRAGEVANGSALIIPTWEDDEK